MDTSFILLEKRIQTQVRTERTQQCLTGNWKYQHESQKDKYVIYVYALYSERI